MYGYLGKLLFVNLSTGETEVRPLSEEIAKNFLGGPALGARILYDEMPAKADVFGEDSMIGFVGGPLNDTKAFFGGRYTVVSKSPVTGGWNDANSGGHFGAYLRRSGFDAVFVKGIAKKPVYIFIDDGNVEILDAAPIWGLTTLATEEKLREMHGDKINAALISPGGERLSLMAAVMNDGHRAAGRGGSGAVMGSKKLKALVVKGTHKVEVYDDKAVIAYNKTIKDFMDGPMAGFTGAYKVYGSGVTYIPSSQNGDASVKNWAGAGVVDYPLEIAEKAGSAGMEPFKVKSYHCDKCPLGCGAILSVPSERWDLSHSPRPEYETQGTFGSQMLNGDMESICRANDLCNEYGIDTISAGATVAWAMECYEKGILSLEELDGVRLNWGNGDAIVEMTEKICKLDGIGEVFALGSRAAADKLGKGHECLVTASGIEEPQHDSRLAYGLCRTYQYDPTPGRHVKGGLGIGVTHTTGHTIDYRGTGYQDLQAVIEQEICNSIGYCLFGMLATPPGGMMQQVMNITGFQYSPADIQALGIRMFNMRQAFNLREGLRRKDFTLSERYYRANPPHDGPLANIDIDHELLADNFFNAIGWDMDCVPLKQSLINIGGMDDVIEDIYPQDA
ncbi:aldehyde ferredoxin oxidoreductase family protein [Christensenellaceae bacterium OttesenSCG-928-M15]|nr:aldehyde ferredoxin oxidoreductase family protein [Christensenellaceae bacterium OttesenSCG-928-M15]